MSKNKRYFLIIVALGALVLSSIACDDPPDPTPTPTPTNLNEAVTEAAEETLETAEKAQSTLCNLCLLGGVPEDCTGVCK